MYRCRRYLNSIAVALEAHKESKGDPIRRIFTLPHFESPFLVPDLSASESNGNSNFRSISVSLLSSSHNHPFACNPTTRPSLRVHVVL